MSFWKQFWLAIVLAALIMLALGWGLSHAKAQDAAFGDSIALGTGHALGVETHAQVGAGSCWVLHHVTHKSYRYVVVSAGINDPPGACVRALLGSIVATRVVVILPAPINSAQATVSREAAAHGYPTISYACPGGCSSRSFHPVSYNALARGVRQLWLTR